MAEVLLLFVGLYPIVTAAVWIAGGLLFRLLDELDESEPPEGGWPGVTVLISACNEEPVIEGAVRSVLASDYPELELIVLDDGSTDETASAARAGGRDDPRLEVVRDAENLGKAERLNLGFARARHRLVVVTDADTNLHPQAVKLLVARIERSSLIAAVAGAPYVTNRDTLLSALQSLEAASIIGLIRRTQALAGRVGTIAGVLGLYRRDAVLEVGGFDSRMATEDIELSWRLLLAGWHTTFEPTAIVGMQVPTSVRTLWSQRRRWARGQGEVLRTHLGQVLLWRQRRLWPLALESVGSLLWVGLALLAAVVLTIDLLTGGHPPAAEFALAWGLAVSAVAALQLAFALVLQRRYDPPGLLPFMLGPPYLIAFWLVSAAAAVRSEAPSLIKGPTGRRVAWDLPRERLEPAER
jgi:biofilm PGA synthesis N-glycosyltransferase PgaC